MFGCPNVASVMDGQVKKVLDNKEIICRNLVATDILPLLMAVDTIKTNGKCSVAWLHVMFTQELQKK